jgi:hypothetical protein
MTLLQPQAELLARIRHIWESARTQAARSVNTAHVCANWLIGQQIVEAEQGGTKRAGYGKALLESLSDRLSQDYGDGFSVSALKYMRLFYQAYPELLSNRHALRDELDSDDAWKPGLLHPGLSWTHYRTLLKEARRAAGQEPRQEGRVGAGKRGPGADPPARCDQRPLCAGVPGSAGVSPSGGVTHRRGLDQPTAGLSA